MAKSMTLQQAMTDAANTFVNLVRKDFDSKFLSRQLVRNINVSTQFFDKTRSGVSSKGKHWEKSYRERIIEIEIAPPRYDTAMFIKTSRKSYSGSRGYGGGFGAVIRRGSGSYASELNKLGSEFEVFKKKPNLPYNISRKTIANIGMNNLLRVKIKPHNHKNYAYNALNMACMNVATNYKGKIEKWDVKN